MFSKMPCNQSNSLNDSIASRISLGLLNRSAASKYSRKGPSKDSIIQNLLGRIDILKNSIKSLERRCDSKDNVIDRLSHIVRYETRPLSPRSRNNYSDSNVISYSSSSESSGDRSDSDIDYHSSLPGRNNNYSDSEESHSTIQDSPQAIISTVPSSPRVVIDTIPPPPPYSSNTPFS